MYCVLHQKCKTLLIYHVSTQRLRKLVVKDSGLVNQLRIMKDFYLLGRGELFLTFIDKASHLLRNSPIPTTEHGESRKDNDARLPENYQ